MEIEFLLLPKTHNTRLIFICSQNHSLKHYSNRAEIKEDQRMGVIPRLVRRGGKKQ
jgi:hypothetical protein